MDDIHAAPGVSGAMHMLVLGTTSGDDSWMNIEVESPLMIPPSVQITGTPVLRMSVRLNIRWSWKPFPITNPCSIGQSAYRQQTAEEARHLFAVHGRGELQDRGKRSGGPGSGRADDRRCGGAKVLGDINVQMLGDSVPAQTVLAEQGRDLGWGVMLAVLVLLGLECVLAMRFGHQRVSGMTCAASGQS